MPSFREHVATLGELGHAAEFWNKLFRSPKQFIKQDLVENPLGLFSMASPFLAPGQSAILTLALLGLAGVPSCVQERFKETTDPIPVQTIPLRATDSENPPRMAVPRPPASAPPSRRSIRWPRPAPRNPEPWHRGITPRFIHRFLPHRPHHHVCWLTADRLPNRRAIESHDHTRDLLKRAGQEATIARAATDVQAATGMGHDIQELY